MRLFLSSVLFAGLGLSDAMFTSLAHAGESESYSVELNKTELLRLPRPANSIIIGNPKIADVTVQSSDLLLVVGRGFGETNLIILDSIGDTILNANLQVVNSLPAQGVRLYNGTSRQTYSCLPYCGPSPVLGDDTAFIGSNSAQEEELNNIGAFEQANPRNSADSFTQNAPVDPAGGPTTATQSRGPS